MSTQESNSLNLEEERLRLIEEMVSDHGPNWAEEFKPGSFGCHELLDRTTLVADTLEQYVLSHPACPHNPEWFALAEQAVTALRELYQRIGAAHMENERPAAGNP